MRFFHFIKEFIFIFALTQLLSTLEAFWYSYKKLCFRYYDDGLVLDDDETKKLFENAGKIMEKESRLKMV